MQRIRSLLLVSGCIILLGIGAATSFGQANDGEARQSERPSSAQQSDRADRSAQRQARRAGQMRWGAALELPHLLERDYAHRDMELISQHLDLHSGQRSILQVLLEEYIVAFETEAEELQQAVAEIEESRRAAREEMREQMRELRQRYREENGGVGSRSVPLTDDDGQEVVIDLGSRSVRVVLDSNFRVTTEPVGGSGRSARGELSRREHARIQEAIREHLREIDPETREAMRERMQERRERARAMREEMRELRREAIEQATDNGINPEYLSQPAEAFLSAKRTLRSQMHEDILLILNDEQAEEWERVERLRYRLRERPRGERPGELVDVERMLENLEITSLPSQEVTRVLERYEVELDRALRDRQRFLEQADIEQVAAMLSREFGDHFRIRLEENRYRSAVERVNRRAIDQLMALCDDPGDKEILRQAKREQMYPELYRPTRADRAIEYALGIDGLDDDQRLQIESQYKSFQQQARRLNDRRFQSLDNMREMREAHMDAALQRIRAGETERAERPPELFDAIEAYRELRDEHRNLIQRQIESLAGVLGDHFEELPQSVREPEARSDRRGRRAGRGDGPRRGWERRRGSDSGGE